MSLWRYPSVVAAAWLCVTSLPHLPVCDAQVVAQNHELRTIDANTRWGFRTLSPVTVHSPIIRFNDVVEPLDPNMAGWQRLRKSPVGLVPLDGRPMTIRRERLAKAIQDVEATPNAIDWIGPAEIKVLYRKSHNAPSRNQTSQSGAVRRTAYAQPAVDTRPRDASQVQPKTAQRSSLSEPEAQRVVHWIELGIKRLVSSVADSYRIEIDTKQPALSALRGISGVTAIEMCTEIKEGRCRFNVVGRGVNGPVEAEIEMMLTAHPRVVMPRRSLARGHQIEARDLKLHPIPEEELDPSFAFDPSELIGLEVRGVVRSGQPINRSDVGSPILVHRGDLIDVRVVGGGITVSTSAKSLGDGAVADPIEIETLQPRRRLVARVVQPGLVEIVTRAPKVSR